MKVLEKVVRTLDGARRSLTIWFNSVCLAVLPALDYAKDAFPQLQEFVGAETYKLMGLVIVGGNIVLRFRTDRSLGAK